MRLTELLHSDDLSRLQSLFAWDVGAVQVSLEARDGVGGWSGSANSRSRSISLDPADVPQLSTGKLSLRDERARETLLHELYHLEQGRRGWWYRLKVWWWNLTIPYREDLSLSPRPHEREARLWAQVQAAAWAT